MEKPIDGKGEQVKQRDRFIETARRLGCDESPAAFDEKLKVIARHKPKVPLDVSKEPKEAE